VKVAAIVLTIAAFSFIFGTIFRQKTCSHELNFVHQHIIHLIAVSMQQTIVPNSRRATNPMIWLTILFHFILGAFLYLKSNEVSPNHKTGVEQGVRP
jgi:hypothetical protein